MRAKSTKRVAAPVATFIFKGTIKKLKATTVTAAPVSDHTCIVTVDRIIEAPQNLAGYAGQDITVELSSRRKVNVGDMMIFHSISWLFGEGVAVHSLYEEIEADTTTRHAAGKQRKPRKARNHFNDADVVISGKVVEVRLPKPGPRNKKAAATPATTHVSEHDPKWREAVIEVAEIHKGSPPAKRQVVIRFPASTDVAWRRAPKFVAGQEGYFMLHQSTRTATGRSTRKKSEASSDPSYTVRDPQDFQPYSEPGGIKAIIESEADS